MVKMTRITSIRNHVVTKYISIQIKIFPNRNSTFQGHTKIFIINSFIIDMISPPCTFTSKKEAISKGMGIEKRQTA